MSGSLASAKAKRAGIAPTTPPPPPPQQQQQQQPPGVRLSIPQVITMLDSRLAKLEIGARSTPAPAPAAAPAFDRSVLEDLDAKFMMLAEEITMMKDVIMKLQAFTMDVNKTLFEERIQIMSEVDGGIKPSQVVEEPSEAITFEKVSDR